ncbi:MAG: hypothetical protein DWQ37_06600 [Planctomycetota bacterium]|nr:MAG: hypothetical protein DWQ37_06600 [Planctomycetota bacterium]
MPGYYTISAAQGLRSDEKPKKGIEEIIVTVTSHDGFEDYVSLEFSADPGPGTSVSVDPTGTTIWLPKDEYVEITVTLDLTGTADPHTCTFFAGNNAVSTDLEVSEPSSEDDARDEAKKERAS